MNTPEYPATIIIGGTGQGTQFSALPDDLVNRQSGTVKLIYNDENGAPHDISSLTSSDFKAVPWDSGETPTTLASGVVGYSQEIFILTTGETPDTSGTFILRVAGEDTAGIAYNATAAIVQAALELLTSRTAGDFEVTISAKENLSFAGAKLRIETSGGFAISFDSTLDATSLPSASISLSVSQSGSDIQNEYSATWVKDSIPAAFSEYDEDKLGAIAFYAALEDGDDYIQNYQRITIFDDAFTNQGGSLPSSATYIYNPTDSNAWLRLASSAPATLNAALDTLAVKNYLNRTVQDIIATPEVSPTDGDAWLVASSSATGDFLGQENTIAHYSSTLAAYTFSNVHAEGDEILNLADGSIYRVNSDNTTWSVASLVGVNAIENTNLAQMTQDTIKGRATASTGDPEDLSSGQVRSILSIDNTDNTSDADKPISDLTVLALADKLDATATAADTLEINGISVNNTAISNGRVLAYNSSGLELEYVDQSSGSGAGITYPFIFSTDVTTTDPGSGAVKFNNVLPASVTEVYISQTANNSVNATLLISSLGSGDSFYIQQTDTDTKNILINVTSVTDNTGWSTIICTVASAGSLPDNAAAVGTIFNYVSGGGGSGVTSLNGRTGAVVTASGDTAATQVTNDSSQSGAFVSDVLDTLGSTSMTLATYDAATISEQLVGLTATQSLTNKDVNGVTLDSTGSVALVLSQAGTYVTQAGASGGEANTGGNSGSGTGTVYIDNTVEVLNFKSFVGGTNVNLTNGIDTITINSTGITAISDATDVSLTSVSAGDLLYYDGADFINLGIGTIGQVLTSTGSIPAWQASTGTGFPSGVVTLTESANVALDFTQGDSFVFDTGTLTQDVILTFTGMVQGQTINLSFTSTSTFNVTLPGTVTPINGGTVTDSAFNIIYIDVVNGSTEQFATFSTS